LPILEEVNIPTPFLEAIQSQLGEPQGKELIHTLQQTISPTSVRYNPTKGYQSSGGLEATPWCSTGYYLKERPIFTLDPAFHAGGYYVQEASSMFLEQAVLQAFDIQQPIRVLDLCAAPGGKSTHLLSLLSPESLVVSNEVIRSRAGVLAENILKWGNTNSIVTNNDPQHFQKLAGYFDLIIVDAPCSGEGLFRKEPEAMQEWSPANVELCSQRQRRILSDVFPALKQNGILIYSTCTYNRLENEENLKWLNNNQQVEFISIPIKPEWGIEEVNESGIQGYRFYPHKVQGEGFFISVIRKLSRETETIFRTKEKNKPNKSIDKIRAWIKEPASYCYLDRLEGARVFPEAYQPDVEAIGKLLYIIQAGTLTGAFKHDKFIPDHALALSNILNPTHTSRVALNKEQALQYLRKDTLTLANAPLGYSLVTYENLGLGWINGLGNRINNLYPTNWRIRMKA
jgi:16S rRNA C967 or C1407 C5-methylase (RsmB/RsmF family)/NOL1/NOP2/fmu family ribosome biogenesis protein